MYKQQSRQQKPSFNDPRIHFDEVRLCTWWPAQFNNIAFYRLLASFWAWQRLLPNINGVNFYFLSKFKEIKLGRKSLSVPLTWMLCTHDRVKFRENWGVFPKHVREHFLFAICKKRGIFWNGVLKISKIGYILGNKFAISFVCVLEL